MSRAGAVPRRLHARRGTGRAPDEVPRVRWIRGPQTVAELAASGPVGGILLLVALVALQARAPSAPLPVVPSRASAQGPPPPVPTGASPGGLGRGRLRFPVPTVSPAAMSDLPALA